MKIACRMCGHLFSGICCPECKAIRFSVAMIIAGIIPFVIYAIIIACIPSVKTPSLVHEPNNCITFMLCSKEGIVGGMLCPGFCIFTLALFLYLIWPSRMMRSALDQMKDETTARKCMGWLMTAFCSLPSIIGITLILAVCFFVGIHSCIDYYCIVAKPDRMALHSLLWSHEIEWTNICSVRLTSNKRSEKIASTFIVEDNQGNKYESGPILLEMKDNDFKEQVKLLQEMHQTLQDRIGGRKR